jgi:hypothetical protein
MDWLIWLGAAVSVVGLAGIIWCVLIVIRAKRAKLEDAAMKAQLARVMPLNMGALLLSAIGLMMVVMGIVLG